MLPARSGTIVAHPAENAAFPGFLEFIDPGTRKKICLDTRNYMGQRSIALAIEPGTYSFNFDGSRMIIIPSKDPIIITDFPQVSGWYPYHQATGIPVVSGGVLDPYGHKPGRFLWRARDCWIGMPSRNINNGNFEESYISLLAKPSTLQAVFVWEDCPARGALEEPDARRRAPKRVMVQVPVTAPVPEKNGPDQQPEKPGMTYAQFVREWNIRRAMHGLDPAKYPDPGVPPGQQEFERLLREGKIRAEK